MTKSESRRCHSSSGVSLLELIVVLGVIAVLIAILLPVLAHGREAGRRTVCFAHLRAFQAATALYATVHKVLPIAPEYIQLRKSERRLIDAIQDHLDGVPPAWDGTVMSATAPWRCPSDPAFWTHIGTSYSYLAGSMMANYGFTTEPDPALEPWVRQLLEGDRFNLRVPVFADAARPTDGVVPSPFHDGPQYRNAVYWDGSVGMTGQTPSK